MSSESSGLSRQPFLPPGEGDYLNLAALRKGEPAFPDDAWAPTPSAAGALAFLRGAVLVVASVASGAVAAFGLALLAYLLLTRALTPPHSLYARALHLDFAAADIVGEAAFLPLAQAGGGVPADLPPSTRVLQAGQVADVWVELRVPRTLPSGGGMVQLVAELTSADGRVAGRASKPVLLRSTGAGVWSALTAPARWVGLGGDSSLLVVPLLSGYREAAAPPAVIFRLYIKSRNPTWAPEVLGAEVKLALRMGLLRRALYALRPRTLVGILLGAAALLATLGGSAVALLLLGLWLYPAVAGGGKGGQEEGSSVSGLLGELSSASAASEDEGRSEGSEAESEGGEGQAGEQHPWHDVSGLGSISELGAPLQRGPPPLSGLRNRIHPAGSSGSKGG